MHTDQFLNHINTTLKHAINEVAEKEIEKAQKKVAERIHQQLDSLALSILKEYEVYSDRNKIVIEVKKR